MEKQQAGLRLRARAQRLALNGQGSQRSLEWAT